MRALLVLLLAGQLVPADVRADWIKPWTWLGGERPARIERAGQKGWKAVELQVVTEPAEIKLSANRRLQVNLTLRNRGKRTVNLQFPNSQRYEILIKDSGGKVLGRWSEDRAFAPALGGLILNPGEKVEYSETISLRELKGGGDYALEVFFPAYPEIRYTVALKPKP